MGRDTVHFVYCLTSPSGRSYVGYTSQLVKERWRQHVARALKGALHPLSAAIRKYGKDSFTVRTVAKYTTRREALAREIVEIAKLQNAYNLSPGGELDFEFAHEAFRKKLLDPAWAAEYKKKLSAAIKNSPAHRAWWAHLTALGVKWKKENPREAGKIQRRATRVAAKTPTAAWNKGVQHSEKAKAKMAESQLQRWADALPSVRKRRQYTARRAAKEVWAVRTEEQKQHLSEAIAAGVKRHNENLTPEGLAERDARLAETRKHIDHTYRKAQQKKGLVAYWTPERRQAKREAMATLWAARKAEK